MPNVEAAYRRAIELGATSIGAAEDAPLGDRIACVRDSYGNRWWLATFKGGK